MTRIFSRSGFLFKGINSAEENHFSRRAIMHPFEAPILLGIMISTIVFLTILVLGVPDFMQQAALGQMAYQRAFEASDYVAKVCAAQEVDLDCVSSKFNGAKKLGVFVSGRRFGEAYAGRGTVYRVRRAVLSGGRPSLLEVVAWY